jgi:hypothetical protein
MYRVQTWLVTALVGLCAAQGAFAAAGITATDVAARSTTVTYSRPADPPRIAALTTYVAYSVTVRNTSGNTINNVVLEGTAVVAEPLEVLTFSSADGASCTATGPGNPVRISCSLGQLRANASVPFTIFFIAPIQNGATTPDYVGFYGRVITAEGANKGNSPNDSVDFWPLPANSQTPRACAGPSLENPDVPQPCVGVDLGTPQLSSVKSAVPKSGGTVFTGEGAVATTVDPWTTTIVIPASGSITTADVFETINPSAIAPDLLNLSSSALTIPGEFAKLVITLRRDVSTLAKGAKISSAKIYYNNPSHPDPRINYDGLGYLVLPCSDTTWGALPQLGIPCLFKRTAYTKRTAPTPDWEGDWEFIIYALDNGKYEQ